MSNVEAAWVGALVEGEGTIMIYPQPNKRIRVGIQVGSTEVETIATLLRLTGTGNVSYDPWQRKTHGHKDKWVWNVSNSAACFNLLTFLVSFLTSKQDRARHAMAALSPEFVACLPC